MEEQPLPYHIYLLTVWQEDGGLEGSQWRFRLVDPQSGVDCGFVTPQALPYALRQLRGNGEPTDTPD